ncbi:MAG: hypothetical protein H7338_11865 [Candidatus Sericytochromatia bacterium]|nr:hypothetical protein [Candidatus Sericytochromatia bacterium]
MSTSAEIRSALESARISAHADGRRNANVTDVLQALQETTPASQGVAEQVGAMRKIAKKIGRPVGSGYTD